MGFEPFGFRIDSKDEYGLVQSQSTKLSSEIRRFVCNAKLWTFWSFYSMQKLWNITFKL